MRNLKRVLTLVMAVAMMMSLLVVGASAKFPDQNKIENTDAVNMNVALGIIKGRDTGDFDPTGNVTRAEMAKMICVLLNGGNEPTLGSKATPSYKDIKGHWAEAYIEYCTSLGIVAGMGDGTFAPNANVTGTQAAKMLLVALGYDAVFEGFNGASWSVKINVAANQKALYDELSIDPNAPLNRDNAAQMVWNALNAVEVKYTYSLTTVNGQLQNVQVREDKTGVPTPTLMASKFKTGADFSKVMTQYNWVSADKKFTYTFSDNTQFKSKEDYTSLFRMNTKVVYKGTAGTSATVYGMYADDAKVLATGILNDLELDGSDIKFDDVKFKLDGALVDTKVYAENTAPVSPLNLTSGALISAGSVTTLYAPYTAKLIDNDNDGKVDCIVYLPFTVEKITFVDSKSVTTANNTYKFDDCDIYSGAKKDDWVMVVDSANAAKGDTTLTKLSAVNGSISSLKSATKIVVGGKTYQNAVGVTGDTTYKIGNDMDLIVVNGFIFNAKKVAGTISTDKIAFVIQADAVGTGTEAGKQQVQLMFADGTKKVIKVAKIDGNDVKDAPTAGPVYGTVQAGDHFFTYTGGTGNYAIETIYTYTVNKDGNYEIDPITYGAGGNYDAKNVAAGANLVDGKITASGRTVRFADDAVVFYLAGGKYKVATGAAVNSWAKYDSSNVSGDLYTNETNGFYYTQVGFVRLPSAPADKDTKFGYIVASPELVKDGSDYYYQVKIWNGTENVTYRAESTATNSTVTSSAATMGSDTNVAKGTAVSYKIVGDGIIESVTALSNKNAVVAYTDGKNYVGFQGNVVGSAGGAAKELKLTSDTVIIRFSSEDVEGQAGNTITLAKETVVSGTYFLNCYVVANTDNEVEALIIDKDSNLGHAPNATIPTSVVLGAGSATSATVTGAPATLVVGTPGAVTGFVATTADKVAITTTAAAGTTCTMTINGVAYTSGTDYTIAAVGTYTVIVSVTEAGRTPATYTYTFAVTA